MATPRPRPLIQLISLAILLTAVRVAASGAWFDDEPPHSLASDLDRLPAKSLGEILLETAAKIPPTEAPKPVAPEEVTAIIEDIGSAKPAALAARIDDLAMRARATYPKTSELLAMLYDVRDAITAAGPDKAACQAYAQERVAEPPRALLVRSEMHRFVGKVKPAPIKVAETIAKTTGSLVQVHSAEAAHQFGLTPQTPTQPVFSTSGPSKRIRVGKPEIRLQHVCQRQLALAGRPAGLALAALCYRGKNK